MDDECPSNGLIDWHQGGNRTLNQISIQVSLFGRRRNWKVEEEKAGFVSLVSSGCVNRAIVHSRRAAVGEGVDLLLDRRVFAAVWRDSSSGFGAPVSPTCAFQDPLRFFDWLT